MLSFESGSPNFPFFSISNMTTPSKPLDTFSSDKLDLQDPKWRDKEGTAPEAPDDKGDSSPEEIPENSPKVELQGGFRPPSIVTETRIRNVIDRQAPADSYTVIVVQGDDPSVVASQIAALRKLLCEEETNAKTQ
jgi:hypothetical protein